MSKTISRVGERQLISTLDLARWLLLLLVFVSKNVQAANDLFDTNKVLSIEIKIAPVDWKLLRYQHRESEFFPEEGVTTPTNAYSWFPAEVALNGGSFRKAEVRKKGYIGSNDTKRPGLKIRLKQLPDKRSNSDDPELTLNNNNQDPALVRQPLAYEVFRRAGIPAPRCNFAAVAVNGKSLGIYTHVEAIKEPFLKRHFNSANGNLYEGGRSDFRPGWFQNFEIKNNENTNHRADLQAATRAIDSAKGSLMPVLDRYFNTEEFFRFWAVESLINFSDGYAGNANNFYLYHDPVTDRFVFIPWGADSVFYPGRGFNSTKGDPKSVIGVGLLANRLYNSPDGAERYRKTLRRILSDAWNEEALLQEVNRLEALISSAFPSGAQEFKENVEGVRQFIKTRRSVLQPELDGPVPDLKSKPLEIAKRRNVGSFEGTFSTVWAQVNPADTFGQGTATLTGKLWGETIQFSKVGIQAGGRKDDSSEEQPVITLNGVDSAKEQRYLIYLAIDPESYAAGTPIAIDNTHIFGGLVQMDEKGQSSKMIGMLRGSLWLKSANREAGGKIEGEFKADVFSKLPKP